MATVCPQRIIAEAIRLLELHEMLHHDDEEALENSLLELRSLSRALYRDGVTKIEEAPH